MPDNNNQITSISQTLKNESASPETNFEERENFTIAPFPKEENLNTGEEALIKSAEKEVVDTLAEPTASPMDEEPKSDNSKEIDKTTARPGSNENDKIDTITDTDVNKQQRDGDQGENLFIENWTKENKVDQIF